MTSPSKPGSPRPAPMVFGLVAPPGDGEGGAAFEKLAAWMRASGSIELERKAWPTYRALAESVREGKSDIAWLPPVVYAWLAEAVNPLGCIARDGNTSYAAALVTLEDSGVRALGDLAGKRAGWVDPLSAAGYVVPRLELSRAGIDPAATFASEKFYGTHRDALLALGRGDCDVVGTFEGAWSELEGLPVRVVATFGSIPGDVVAVRRNLPPADFEAALEAFRRARSDAGARPLMRAVFGGDELREGVEPGHETLRIDFERATANGLFD